MPAVEVEVTLDAVASCETLTEWLPTAAELSTDARIAEEVDAMLIALKKDGLIKLVLEKSLKLFLKNLLWKLLIWVIRSR